MMCTCTKNSLAFNKMDQIKRAVLSGIGTTLSVVGVSTGVAATTLAVVHAAPVAIVATSVVAPIACAYNVFFGDSLATRWELKKLREDSERRKEQLRQQEELIKKQEEQLKTQVDLVNQQKEQIDTQEQLLEKQKGQLLEQEEQIKKLWEIHAQLRQALQGLAVAGDTFNQFGYVLSGHMETLSQKIENLSETSNSLNNTAVMLNQLTHSLENHINNDDELKRNREILFGVLDSSQN